jgi:hypothetical protein
MGDRWLKPAAEAPREKRYAYRRALESGDATWDQLARGGNA